MFNFVDSNYRYALAMPQKVQQMLVYFFVCMLIGEVVHKNPSRVQGFIHTLF